VVETSCAIVEEDKKFGAFLSIKLLNGKVCEREVIMKPFELLNNFDTIGQAGKVCSCESAFNVISVSLGGAPQHIKFKIR